MNKQILLVEDNDAHAYLIEYCLREVPLVDHVERARDGEEALAFLFDTQSSTKPALILLDLHLPRLSGFEVLQHVRATPILMDVPIVILSTSNAEADAAKAYTLHANGYLVKPSSATLFYDMLSATVRYWLRWNRDRNLRVAAEDPWSRSLSRMRSGMKM